jgi:hypothetical protein
MLDVVDREVRTVLPAYDRGRFSLLQRFHRGPRQGARRSILALQLAILTRRARHAIGKGELVDLAGDYFTCLRRGSRGRGVLRRMGLGRRYESREQGAQEQSAENATRFDDYTCSQLVFDKGDRPRGLCHWNYANVIQECLKNAVSRAAHVEQDCPNSSPHGLTAGKCARAHLTPRV